MYRCIFIPFILFFYASVLRLIFINTGGHFLKNDIETSSIGVWFIQSLYQFGKSLSCKLYRTRYKEKNIYIFKKEKENCKIKSAYYTHVYMVPFLFMFLCIWNITRNSDLFSEKYEVKADRQFNIINLWLLIYSKIVSLVHILTIFNRKSDPNFVRSNISFIFIKQHY